MLGDVWLVSRVFFMGRFEGEETYPWGRLGMMGRGLLLWCFLSNVRRFCNLNRSYPELVQRFLKVVRKMAQNVRTKILNVQTHKNVVRTDFYSTKHAVLGALLPDSYKISLSRPPCSSSPQPSRAPKIQKSASPIPKKQFPPSL